MEQACTTAIAGPSLLLATPDRVLDSERIRELEFGEGSPARGAGDGWDGVRLILRDYAPGGSLVQEAAERQP
jgi:hypothetical protein